MKIQEIQCFFQRNIVNRDKHQDDPDFGTGKQGF